MKEQEMNEKIASAKLSPAGTRIVYHRGELGRDSRSDAYSEAWKQYMHVAEAFYNLYLDGYVALVQKAGKVIGTFGGEPYREFEYIAIVLPPEGREKRAVENWLIFNSMRSVANPYVSRKLAAVSMLAATSVRKPQRAALRQ